MKTKMRKTPFVLLTALGFAAGLYMLQIMT
jgi:hypothetical protein